MSKEIRVRQLVELGAFKDALPSVEEYMRENRVEIEREEAVERSRFIAAINAGERAILDGRTKSAEEVFADLRAKHGF